MEEGPRRGTFRLWFNLVLGLCLCSGVVVVTVQDPAIWVEFSETGKAGITMPGWMGFWIPFAATGYVAYRLFKRYGRGDKEQSTRHHLTYVQPPQPPREGHGAGRGRGRERRLGGFLQQEGISPRVWV